MIKKCAVGLAQAFRERSWSSCGRVRGLPGEEHVRSGIGPSGEGVSRPGTDTPVASYKGTRHQRAEVDTRNALFLPFQQSKVGKGSLRDNLD
jgi:hypothetical protein